MIVTAIVLAIIAAVLEACGFAIAEPWRKIVWIGILVLLIVGIILLFVPGLPVKVGWY